MKEVLLERVDNCYKEEESVRTGKRAYGET